MPNKTVTALCACGCGQECKIEPHQSFGRVNWPVHICGVDETGVTKKYREQCVALALREFINARTI